MKTFREACLNERKVEVNEAKLTPNVVYSTIHDAILNAAWGTPMKDSPEEVLTVIVKMIAKDLMEDLEDQIKSGDVEDDDSAAEALESYERFTKAKVKIS